jgi:hypothetical protein
VFPKYTAGNRASAASDDKLWFNDCFIGLEQRFPHILGYRTSDKNAIGVTRRGDEFDPKSTGIEDDIAEGICFDLAAIAASGTDLAQAQRSSEQSLQFTAQRFDFQRTVAGYDETLARRSREPPVPAEDDGSARARRSAFPTEDALADVKLGAGSGNAQRIGRTGVDTLCAVWRTQIGIDHRATAKQRR